MSEIVDGSLRTEKTSKFITETKQINKDSLFIFFPSSKSVKIARLAIQRNPINQSYQRIKKKITLFFLMDFI